MPRSAAPFFFINGVWADSAPRLSCRPIPSSAPIHCCRPIQAYPPPRAWMARATPKTRSDGQSLLSLRLLRSSGEYWFAVGLDVSSFEMIEVSAILSIAFGVNLQIGVIGSASMTLPVRGPGRSPMCRSASEVSYSSDDGLLADGAITPASFIYAGAGPSFGRLLYTWLSGRTPATLC